MTHGPGQPRVLQWQLASPESRVAPAYPEDMPSKSHQGREDLEGLHCPPSSRPLPLLHARGFQSAPSPCKKPLSSCGNGFDHDHPCGTDGGAQGGASPQIPQPESRSARNEEFPSPAGRLFPPHGLLQGLREARTRTESSVSPNPRSCLRPC